MLKVYVATSWGNWKEAKGAADAMAWLDMECTSSWIAQAAAGVPGDAQAEEAVLFAAHETNYKDIGRSDAILVMRTAESGETLVEFAHALWKMSIPILWIGRPILSAKVAKDRVRFPASKMEALQMLASLQGLP